MRGEGAAGNLRLVLQGGRRLQHAEQKQQRYRYECAHGGKYTGNDAPCERSGQIVLYACTATESVVGWIGFLEGPEP